MAYVEDQIRGQLLLTEKTPQEHPPMCAPLPRLVGRDSRVSLSYSSIKGKADRIGLE